MMPKNRPVLYYCIFAFTLLVCQLNAQTVRNDAVRFYHMGREALNQNRILDAIQFFQQSSEYNENYSDAYRETARAFYYLDELDEAEDYIMQALNLAPLDSRNLNLYGRILITGGKFDDAEIIFT
ncbi:MAG: tetratricopeptide repeat protein, partial [Salinispira sp.]